MEDGTISAVLEVNGVSLHTWRAGQGRPVVLLHGNGESHAIFSETIRQLADAGYEVFAPDSRGQGANDPLAEYHYADMAEDVYCLIQALGLAPCALYGSSDGGIVGLLLALSHPGALRLLAVSGANRTPEGLEAGLLEEMREEYGRTGSALLRLMLTEPHIDARRLAGIDIPVLVTAGSEDVIRPEETRRIARALKHARLEIVQGAGHDSYIASSPVIGEMLIGFLRQNGY